MKYRLPVTIEKNSDHEYMARSEPVRATAVGETPEEAIKNLKEAIEALVEEFGAELVFKDLDKNIDYSFVEVGT